MNSVTLDRLRRKVQGPMPAEMTNPDELPVPIPLDSSMVDGPGPLQPGGEGELVSPTPAPMGIFGWPQQTRRPKDDLRYPEIPGNYDATTGITTSANTGVLLQKQLGFPVHTIIIDNYSAIWLYVEAAAKYVPPFCIGVQWPLGVGPNTITIRAEQPPTFTQPAANTTQMFSVYSFECEFETVSPGLSIPSTQHP